MSEPFETNAVTGQRIDKVRRYKWGGHPGAPGKPMHLPKESLRVHGYADGGYQRNMNDRVRLSIAREFNWQSFGVLVVSQRQDGSLWVVDGQNRHAAAMEREDVSLVPCMVFRLNTLREEAQAFLRLNKNRGLPKTLQMLPAQVHAGDATAVALQELVAGTGRTISSNSSPTTFACVTALMRALRLNGEALDRIWPLLVELTRGRPFHNVILEGFWYIEARLPEGVSLADAAFRRRALSIGYEELLEAAGRAAAYHAKGGAKIWAQGIRDRLNKGASKNIVPVTD